MANDSDTYRTLTPYLIVQDAQRELDFLRSAFGAVETLCHRDDKGAVMHAEMRIGDSLVMIGQSNAQWKPLTGSIYLWISEVDDTYAKAIAAGARSLSEPEDKPYGHRNAGVVDANDVTWWIAAPVR